MKKCVTSSAYLPFHAGYVFFFCTDGMIQYPLSICVYVYKINNLFARTYAIKKNVNGVTVRAGQCVAGRDVWVSPPLSPSQFFCH